MSGPKRSGRKSGAPELGPTCDPAPAVPPSAPSSAVTPGQDSPASSDKRLNHTGFSPPSTMAPGPGAITRFHSEYGDGRAVHPPPANAGPVFSPPRVTKPKMKTSRPFLNTAPAADADQQPLLFEIAWEVCWQLGGIYTVLRSKAGSMVNAWGDRYYLIGPYNADTAAVEFEPAAPTGWMAQVIERLADVSIRVHHGRWLIDGRPRVILLDYPSAFERLGEFKYMLWKDHGIQANDDDGDINNVTAFGFLVGLFFQELCRSRGAGPIIAHFHEWMAGLGLMRLAYLKLPVASVFTTHATILGRYLCTDNPDFYGKLDSINPDHAAGHYRIYQRYCIERGATHCADVFTTVSDVTALEAERLLNRKPDIITPNGLNIQKFAALHEFQTMHKQYKEAIHTFVAGHFFPSYTFDLDRTIYLFTAGRYEYTNKGINLFIESLARLNHWLRSGNIPVTVVAFIITRAPYKSINVDVLRSQAMFDELKLACENIAAKMGRTLLSAVSMGRLPEGSELLTEESVIRLKRGLHAWRTWKQPAIVTHDLWDDANDSILQQLRACRLFNAREDPVKVVFHPDFLSATSPLIGLDYDQFVRGCHMGVFPSYYEPWGYTPMECVASGVPAVTSDLAGFGSYVLKHIQDPPANGLFVIGRRYTAFDQAAHQLTEILFNFALKDRRERIELRNRVERLSEYFAWTNLVSHYAHVYRLALLRKFPAAVS